MLEQEIDQKLSGFDESSLRVDKWDEYIGQKQLKENLWVAISAAKDRDEALGHVLLYGPPGLGKTTMAHLISKMMDKSIRITSGPAITRIGDLASLLTSMNDGDVLFIDEIHRLPKTVEEGLYPALEDFAIDVVLGKGPGARSVRLDLPKFTLVGATTKAGMIAGPLRDRFGMVARLEFYSDDELSLIVKNAGNKLGVKIDENGAKEIAKRSRKTARIALKLLKWARDLAQVEKKVMLEQEIVKKALGMLNIDDYGLGEQDRVMLGKIIEHHQGGPVGLDTIASMIHEDKDTVVDLYEPFLLAEGFLKRTPRGREATKKAYEHLRLAHLFKN